MSIANEHTIERCKAMLQADKRLACYDSFHQFQGENVQTLEVVSIDNPIIETSRFQPSVSKVLPNDYSLMVHRKSYFLPVSFTKNRRDIASITDNAIDDEASFDDLEVKFQVSLKLNLWDDVVGKNSQLMAAYTQKSFWQMYNSDLSSVFRESNYEPEIFINKDLSHEIFGFNMTSAQVGFVHQSNGRSQLLSRSWNRIYGNVVLQRDNFALSLKPWYRIQEDFDDDDNPDIEDYFGKYELGLYYRYRGSEFTALVRNLSAKHHSTSYQLSWQYPIGRGINFYLEYFNGYGESLIDYNFRNETFGMGFTIGDWVK